MTNRLLSAQYIRFHLMGLVGGRVYPLRQRRGDGYPVVIYESIEQDSETFFDAGPYPLVNFYRLYIHAKTLEDLESLELRIRGALHQGGRLVSMEGSGDDWDEEHEIEIRSMRVGIRN